MDTKYINWLYEYNRWANARVLGAVAKLNADQFTKDLGNSFRSVRDTLVHIMAAEWIWLMRWKGTSPKAMLKSTDFSSLDALRSKWAEIEREQTEYLRGLTDESIQKVLAYTSTEGKDFKNPLWQLMPHVVNHSTYHRGQVTTMLRQLGAEPVSTDLVTFCRMTS
jgi:uncharacterized damage-inducible protein DinB